MAEDEFSVSVSNDAGDSETVRGLFPSTQFSLLRAKVDAAFGLASNQRSVLLKGEMQLGLHVTGKTLCEMGVSHGMPLKTRWEPCPELPPMTFQCKKPIV